MTATPSRNQPVPKFPTAAPVSATKSPPPKRTLIRLPRRGSRSEYAMTQTSSGRMETSAQPKLVEQLCRVWASMMAKPSSLPNRSRLQANRHTAAPRWPLPCHGLTTVKEIAWMCGTLVGRVTNSAIHVGSLCWIIGNNVSSSPLSFSAAN